MRHLAEFNNFQFCNHKLPYRLRLVKSIKMIIFVYLCGLKLTDNKDEIVDSIQKGHPKMNNFGYFVDSCIPREFVSIGLHTTAGLYYYPQCERHGYHRDLDCNGCKIVEKILNSLIILDIELPLKEEKIIKDLKLMIYVLLKYNYKYVTLTNKYDEDQYFETTNPIPIKIKYVSL